METIKYILNKIGLICKVGLTKNGIGTFIFYFIIFKDFIYFLTEGKGGRKRGRETSIYGWLSHSPYWGPGLQPRQVPWLGIKPATLCFTAHAQPTELHQSEPVGILQV